ncbi:MAG: hypothetical protein H6658_03555 [Ardenticatenaceae bacterium]|nr:hypothetical protein [Ardenticatenaceae bacterium]
MAVENSVGINENLPPGLELVQNLSGHRNVVYECAWSPRGRVLVSVAADRTICRWDLQRGKPVQSSQEFYDFLFSVAWSPNGRYLATASFDKTVRVIYAGSGKQAHALSGHKGPVFSVAWSRTSRYLASASDDKTVRVWDGDSRWKPHILEGHEDWVLSVAWSFQEHLLASGSRDKTVRVWDVRETTPQLVLRGHTDIVNCVAWSPNGRYLASASDDKEVRVWNAQTERQVIVLSRHSAPVLSVRFSPDGRLLATKSRDGTVQLWDTHHWKLAAVLEESVRSDLCNGLAFHPNKHQLATLSHDQKGLRIWQLDYGTLLGESAQPQRIHPLVCPDCAELIPASMVNRRRERGHDTLTCPVCDTVISLLMTELTEPPVEKKKKRSEILTVAIAVKEEVAAAKADELVAVQPVRPSRQAARPVNSQPEPETKLLSRLGDEFPEEEPTDPQVDFATQLMQSAKEKPVDENAAEETAVPPSEPDTKPLDEAVKKTAVSVEETAVQSIKN